MSASNFNLSNLIKTDNKRIIIKESNYNEDNVRANIIKSNKIRNLCSNINSLDIIPKLPILPIPIHNYKVKG